MRKCADGDPGRQYLALVARRAEARANAHHRFALFLDAAAEIGVPHVGDLGTIVGGGKLKLFRERGMKLAEYMQARSALWRWRQSRDERRRLVRQLEIDALISEARVQ